MSRPPVGRDDEAQNLWEIALAQLQLQVTRPNFETWLKDTVGMRFDNGLFVVGAPNDFATEWLSTKLRPLIAKTLSGIIGHPVEVTFRLIGPQAGRCALQRTRPLRARSCRPPPPPIRPMPAAPPQPALHLRAICRRPREPPGPRRLAGGRRQARRCLQPAVHLRRHRPGQDPPPPRHRPPRLEPATTASSTSPPSSSPTSSSTSIARAAPRSSGPSTATWTSSSSTTSSSWPARSAPRRSSSTPSTTSIPPAARS